MDTVVPAPPAIAPAALWLGLILTPGLGHRGLQKLIAHLGSAEAIYAASLTALEACELPPSVAHHIHDGRSQALGIEEAEKAAKAAVQVITLADPAYPELLREIPDPPAVLYVRGAPTALDSFGIAVVGTRHPTVYGRLMAERLGGDLARWGLTVFSGLARGIDAAGQKACVEAGGRTVAVLGSGVDIIYPREHAKLADSLLAASGALVSEFPLGAVPVSQNFPIRNRIISGLSLGVLVIEGGEYSGSRITARMALEQNREVFAVPGMATQSQSWLPNTLIKQGAKLVTEVADIVEELPSAARLRLTPPPDPANSAERADAPAEAASRPLQALLGLLPVDEALHVDDIVARLQDRLTAPEALTLLLELELGGQIRQLPGKKYLRVS